MRIEVAYAAVCWLILYPVSSAASTSESISASITAMKPYLQGSNGLFKVVVLPEPGRHKGLPAEFPFSSFSSLS